MGALIEKTPWPAQGIVYGSRPEEYVWGYLYLYDDGNFHFRADEEPSDEEVWDRWGHYFDGNSPNRPS